VHNAGERTLDLFGKALNLSKSLLGPWTGNKSHTLVENDIIFNKNTIWVFWSLFQGHQEPSCQLELDKVVLVLFLS
jgi:hypothetical protein